MAAKKKKRTPAQERATRRMIAARKKQLRKKKKPAKKRTAKKKAARRVLKKNPAARKSSRPRPMYYVQDKRSGQWWSGQYPRFTWTSQKSDRVGTASMNHAKMLAVWLANKTRRPLAVIRE